MNLAAGIRKLEEAKKKKNSKRSIANPILDGMIIQDENILVRGLEFARHHQKTIALMNITPFTPPGCCSNCKAFALEILRVTESEQLIFVFNQFKTSAPSILGHSFPKIVRNAITITPLGTDIGNMEIHISHIKPFFFKSAELTWASVRSN